MYSEEWNLRMYGRTAFTHVGRLGEVLGLLGIGIEAEILQRRRETCRSAQSRTHDAAVVEASTTTAGSKIMRSESTGASAMRFLISATL